MTEQTPSAETPAAPTLYIASFLMSGKGSPAIRMYEVPTLSYDDCYRTAVSIVVRLRDAGWTVTDLEVHVYALIPWASPNEPIPFIPTTLEVSDTARYTQ